MQELDKLMAMLAATQENECDCATVDAVMEEVAELMAQGVDVAEAHPDIVHHLTLCNCCHDELRALLNILDSAETSTPQGEPT